MTDIYDGIARDLSDGAVQRIDENPVVREFFDLPTHESAARILAEEWRDSVIFESFGRGFADRKAGRFYRRTAGGCAHYGQLSLWQAESAAEGEARAAGRQYDSELHRADCGSRHQRGDW